MNDKLPATVATYELDAHWRAELKSNGDVVIITDINHVECVLSAKRAHNLLRLLIEHHILLYEKAYPEQQAQASYERVKPAIAAHLAVHPSVPDDDYTPVVCPSCHRTIGKAGLITLPDSVVCDYCFTLPRWLKQFGEGGNS